MGSPSKRSAPQREARIYPVGLMENHRDSSYLEFIRSRPCIVSGSEVDVVAHHVRCLGGGGMGLKPSDYMCVPLTAYLHALLHQQGERNFYSQYGINIEDQLKMLLLIYLAKNYKVDYKFIIERSFS